MVWGFGASLGLVGFMGFGVYRVEVGYCPRTVTVYKSSYYEGPYISIL